MNCPKCTKEISEVEYYKYHLRCKDCWNLYCKSHRYYNKNSQMLANKKYKEAHPITERHCKKCNTTKPIDSFAPKKHYCKDCYRSPNEIKKAYQINNPEKVKHFRKEWRKNNRYRFLSKRLQAKKLKENFSELRYIAQKAVELNDTYNFDEVIDKRPFNF